MKIDDLPMVPALPELVETECNEVSGLDLLGLRSAAESVASTQLNGVTTVTPTARYISLYAWIIKRYFDLEGTDSYSAFVRFAKKIEAAVAIGNLAAEPSTTGLIGSGEGNKRLAEATDRITLGSLVKNPAVGIYGAPSRDLGVTWDRPNVQGLTEERGKPLADAVDQVVSEIDVLHDINLSDDSQEVSLAELRSLGQKFPMGSPSGSDREALVKAILPTSPQRHEVTRLRTYCTLLHIVDSSGKFVPEDDVFRQVLRPDLNEVPVQLHKGYEGWTKFLVRDMLVAVHEAAVSHVGHYLESFHADTKRAPANAVIAGVTEYVDQGLDDLGYENLSADSAIAELCSDVLERLGDTTVSGTIRRWPGDLHESYISSRAIDLYDDFASCVLLPIAWILAAERFRRDDHTTTELAMQEGWSGPTRIGVYSVVRPEVDRWRESSTTIRSVVADLIRRSVDQHLRIAWSRLAREPWKDVSVLASDGDEWIHIKRLWAGRPASKLGQALRWLQQLQLVSEEGLTESGRTVLLNRLKTLANLENEDQ